MGCCSSSLELESALGMAMEMPDTPCGARWKSAPACMNRDCVVIYVIVISVARWTRPKPIPVVFMT